MTSDLIDEELPEWAGNSCVAVDILHIGVISAPTFLVESADRCVLEALAKDLITENPKLHHMFKWRKFAGAGVFDRIGVDPTDQMSEDFWTGVFVPN